jgi:tetratricopeptide (TPR) repeat protein
MVKQPQVDETDPQPSVPAPAQEIAREFASIGKLVRLRKVTEALDAANALYAKYPNDPTANFVLALVLEEDGRKSDARVFAEAAARLAPENAGYLVFLGKLYIDLALIEFAPDVLHKAFALDKTMFQAPWALAHYYLESGQGAPALPYFDLALQASPPKSESMIRLDRAMCFLNMGNVREAEAEFKRVMKDPMLRVPALARTVLLNKSDHNSSDADAIRLELERPDLNVNERAWLLLSLGRLHENGRDFDSAFFNFERSRKMRNTKFDPQRFIAIVDDAIKFMTPGALRKFRNFGHGSEKPIFVVGMPRSGTTLTEQVIAAHSMAEGVGELARMSNLATEFSSLNGTRQVLDSMAGAGPERWKDVPQMYLNLLDVLAPNAKHAVDKMPHNFLYLGFIHLCFPNARIIHCQRHPLDTFISSFQNQLNSAHSYSYDQVAYGEYYLNYLRLMHHWQVLMPNSIYNLQYEALAASPEAEVRNVLNFLGLPWEEGCLKFNERDSTVRTLSGLQVRNSINIGSVGRWRNYEKHLGSIIGIFEGAGIPI